jgi:DNA-binding PadR family transcriptional regulator
MSRYAIAPFIVTTCLMIPKALVAASIKPFVLSVLAEGESYGYAIIQRVKALTGGRIAWTTSTLYPVLHSLENKGLLESQWQVSQEGPRRKYYRLTPKGRKALEREKRQWLDVHQALMELWNPTPGELAVG